MLAGRRGARLANLLTWLTGGALALDLLLIAGVIALVAAKGLAHFRQGELVLLELRDGERVLGELSDQERSDAGERLRIHVANRDLGELDFRWIDANAIRARSTPADAVLLERLEWGRFHGFARELRRGEELLASGADAVWAALPALLAARQADRDALEHRERREVAVLSDALDRARLASAPTAQQAELQARLDGLAADLAARRRALAADELVLETASGQRTRLPVADVVRAVRPNQLGLLASAALYASRVGEFLLGNPRESNTEGGIFPAIFGTVLMVMLTSLAVAPLGVLAAIYLHEYARDGWLVRTVRISVNSLAGVPSIVFGVFGLGFFVYLVGGTLDELFFAERLPSPTFGTGGILWASLTLALLSVPVVIVSTEEGLASVPRLLREGSLALGATRFETLCRVVLPAAAPGILTGLILAMARAAGEVAPLMIVGMVKLAPGLAIDGQFPYLHLERKFMHLGFHIYDVGFQSPNVEAVQPLVFATALLLILVVLMSNLAAILLRNRLRARHAASAV